MGGPDEIPDKFRWFFWVIEVEELRHSLKSDRVLVDVIWEELDGVGSAVDYLGRGRFHGVKYLSECLKERGELCGGCGLLVLVAVFCIIN